MAYSVAADAKAIEENYLFIFFIFTFCRWLQKG